MSQESFSPLVPNYKKAADLQLDELQVGADERLWIAVVDTIEMICRNDQDGTGRSQRVVGLNGTSAWAVRVPHEADLWILWSESTNHDGERQAVFHHIGPLPARMVT